MLTINKSSGLKRNQTKRDTRYLFMLIAAFALGCGGTSRYGRSLSAETNDLSSFRQTGMASYYGEEFDGHTTANGERFDMHALTAAHRTLPFNTLVKVTNLSNSLSVRVRINDRGPFRKNRIIDLSRAAAEKIGLIATGTAEVELVVISQ